MSGTGASDSQTNLLCPCRLCVQGRAVGSFVRSTRSLRNDGVPAGSQRSAQHSSNEGEEGCLSYAQGRMAEWGALPGKMNR